MNAVFIPFCTPGGHYVFDANRNSILKVDADDYGILLESYKNIRYESNSVINKYRQKGFLLPSNLKEIKHPETEMMEFHLANRIEKITLQLTQECNLRCSYCVYSGNYENRSHGRRSMTFDIAKQGIDFLHSHSKDRHKVNIGFYGGEPLLETDLLEECVEYAEKCFEEKGLTFTITTNGTLLNDSITEFLIKHNFDVLISLDGPKEIHDNNRKLANGKGSFDLIIKNVRNIKEKYPEFFKKINFNVVISPENDFKCVKDFFDAEDVLMSDYINRTTLSDNYAKNKPAYDENFYAVSSYEKFKLYLWLLKKISKRNVSKLFIQDFSRLMLDYEFLSPIRKLPETYHPSGPCLPGVRRPLITIDGKILPCERVNEESETMILGDVYKGIDVEKAKRILNVGQVSKEECKGCWSLLKCTACAAAADENNELTKRKKLLKCGGIRYSALENMKDICFLTENGFDMDYVFDSNEQLGLGEEKDA